MNTEKQAFTDKGLLHSVHNLLKFDNKKMNEQSDINEHNSWTDTLLNKIPDS